MMRALKVFYISVKSILIGMVVTFRNFFAKPVTLQYPVEKMKMTNQFKGLVDLRPEKCVVCYQCVKICPTAALFLSHNYEQTPDNKKKLAIDKFKYDVELCCFCGLCAEICPTEAMYMNKIYEASTYTHEELKIDLMDPKKYKHFENAEETKAEK